MVRVPETNSQGRWGNQLQSSWSACAHSQRAWMRGSERAALKAHSQAQNTVDQQLHGCGSLMWGKTLDSEPVWEKSGWSCGISQTPSHSRLRASAPAVALPETPKPPACTPAPFCYHRCTAATYSEHTGLGSGLHSRGEHSPWRPGTACPACCQPVSGSHFPLPPISSSQESNPWDTQ